jgi:hypothetical protein
VANGGAGRSKEEMPTFPWACNCTICGLDAHGNGWRAHGVCSKVCFRANTGMFFRERTQDDIDREFNGEDFHEDQCKVCGDSTAGSGWEDIGVCSREHLLLWNGSITHHHDLECEEPSCKDEFGAEIACIICGKDATLSGWHMIGCCSRECGKLHMNEFPRRYNYWLRDDEDSDDDTEHLISKTQFAIRRTPRKAHADMGKKIKQKSGSSAAIIASLESDEETEELSYRYGHDSDESYDSEEEYCYDSNQYWEYGYCAYPSMDDE